MARTVAGKGMMLTRVRCLFVFVITLFALDYAGRGITAWADAGGHGRAAQHLAHLWTAAVDASCGLTARVATAACNVAEGGYATRKARTTHGVRHCIIDGGTGTAFSISGRCTGARHMLALIAAVMCLPGKAGRKSLAALAGVAATGVMNVARIAAIATATGDDHGSFAFVHDVTVGVPFTIAVFAVMAACVETHLKAYSNKGQGKE